MSYLYNAHKIRASSWCRLFFSMLHLRNHSAYYAETVGRLASLWRISPKFLTSSREVLGSNSGWDHPEFPWSSSVLSGTHRDSTHNYATPASYHIFTTLLFTCHSVIRRYERWWIKKQTVGDSWYSRLRRRWRFKYCWYTRQRAQLFTVMQFDAYSQKHNCGSPILWPIWKTGLAPFEGMVSWCS